MLNIAFKTTNEYAKPPVYSTDEAAGADLHAAIGPTPISLQPGDRKLIPTGLIIELPKGYEGQIRSRSGLAYKNGVIVLNSPGTIDSDYRGEVKVLLANASTEPFWINNGDRIAQLVIAMHERAEFEQVTDVADTNRGEGGFGSTGVSS